jgi:LCP family protein required for cell wall assembly
MALLSAVTAYGYVHYRLGSIRSVAAAHLSPQERTGENILLIGNQSRAGLGTSIYGSPTLLSGSLSDVIMILHLNPLKQSASILSIPRDLFVPQPAGSPVGPYQKVDAALNDGSKGPDNLIQTLTDDLGIPINHFVELNFDGFQRTVDAVGGINVDFPEPVYDAYSNLDVSTTGCRHLNGVQALALVRARHLQYDPPGVSPSNHGAWPYDPESDLSRVVRDHTFLRILVATAKSEGLSNPLKANAFLGSIIDQITVDPGLKGQLLTLAGLYRHLSPEAIPQTTLPVTQVGGASGYTYNGAAMGDVDFPVQPLDNQIIAAWDGRAQPAPVPPAGVEVTNISGSGHLATSTADALAADHVNIAGVTTGSVPAAETETLVNYRPGQVGEALSVVRNLAGAVMMRSDGSLPSGMVDVDVGSLVAVAGPNGAPPPPSTAATTPATPSSSPSAAATSTVPTPGGQAPSSSTDQVAPYDPRPC